MTKKDPNYAQEAEKYENPIPSREYILGCLAKSDKKLSIVQLFDLLALTAEKDRYALKKRLRAMLRDGQLQQDRRSRYFIAEDSVEFTGTVIGHKDGFGFVSTDDDQDDSYLNVHEMRAVFPGDKVRVRVISTDRKGRSEVTIVEVLERAVTELVGRVVIEHNKLLVSAQSKAISQDILIGSPKDCSHSVGDIVLVKLTEQPTRHSMARGDITEKLGDHLTPGLEVDIAIRMHDLPVKWPQAVLKESDAIPEMLHKKEYAGRKDLRDLPFVTIDGEDAKDFDDAVFCERKIRGGFTLWVAIADVSHYVKPDSALDQEAILRGNSAYFPGRVVPMLPEKLSNGLCSLNPDVDRLVMVCEMHIDQQGKVSRYQFHEGVIHSHARMTYTKVHEILEGNKVLIQEYKALLPVFDDLHALFHVLSKRREKRGAIEFETVETKVLFNEQGKIRQIVPTARNIAHRIIEECMLSANVCAAKFVLKHNKGEMYRVHEGPSVEKYADLQKTLSELGLHLPGGDDIQPKDYATLLQQIADRPDAKLLNTLMLRSLSQAIYSVAQEGHFGLAYAIYTHFTSPIRRYPDLLIHRIIRDIVRERKKRLYSDEKLKEFAAHCSTTERRADLASRDAMDMLKCDFMQDKVGNDYTGSITGVTQFGLFITLDDFYVEGLAHISSLADDYYHFDPANQALTAERSGKKYRLGDSVKIQVARVDIDSRLIDFAIKTNKPKKSKQTKKKRARKRSK